MESHSSNTPIGGGVSVPPAKRRGRLSKVAKAAKLAAAAAAEAATSTTIVNATLPPTSYPLTYAQPLPQQSQIHLPQQEVAHQLDHVSAVEYNNNNNVGSSDAFERTAQLMHQHVLAEMSSRPMEGLGQSLLTMGGLPAGQHPLHIAQQHHLQQQREAAAAAAMNGIDIGYAKDFSTVTASAPVKRSRGRPRKTWSSIHVPPLVYPAAHPASTMPLAGIVNMVTPLGTVPPSFSLTLNHAVPSSSNDSNNIGHLGHPNDTIASISSSSSLSSSSITSSSSSSSLPLSSTSSIDSSYPSPQPLLPLAPPSSSSSRSPSGSSPITSDSSSVSSISSSSSSISLTPPDASNNNSSNNNTSPSSASSSSSGSHHYHHHNNDTFGEYEENDHHHDTIGYDDFPDHHDDDMDAQLVPPSMLDLPVATTTLGANGICIACPSCHSVKIHPSCAIHSPAGFQQAQLERAAQEKAEQGSWVESQCTCMQHCGGVIDGGISTNMAADCVAAAVASVAPPPVPRHIPEPHLECQYGCGKLFRYATARRIHERSHTGERPFACTWPNCNKAFTARNMLTKHVKIHADQPMSCPFPPCTKTFSALSSLKRHTRIHTKELPFECKHEVNNFNRRRSTTCIVLIIYGMNV
jgi:hypothetical protein